MAESDGHSSSGNFQTIALESFAENKSSGGPSVSLTRMQFILVFLGLTLAVFLAALDQTIIGTVLKSIIGDLGYQSLVPWIGSSYLITSCAMTLWYGKLADIFGRKVREFKK